MALLKYLQKEGPVRECSALWKKVTEQVNEHEASFDDCGKETQSCLRFLR